jgi:catechol 1,2-dioxygenase
LTTQIFDRNDKYLDNDSVFAVKDSLVVDFVPRENDPQAAFELNYDVKLVKFEASTDGA